MKALFKIFLLFFVSIAFYSCSKEDEIPVDIEINDFVWKAMNAYYLHQDQVPNLFDRRFLSQPELNNYLRGFENPNELFTSLLFDRPNTDSKSVLIEDYNSITQPNIRVSNTNGLEFGVIAEPGSTDKVLGYVHYILPNSNASTKSIARGDFFYGVNNVQLTRENYRGLLTNQTETLNLNMALFDGIKVVEDSISTSTIKIPKKVLLEKSGYTHEPVFMTKNFTVGSKKVGYLMYNNDFSSNYIKELNNTFLQFKNQGMNQLILDLRYNIGGGSLEATVNQLASMITGQFTNQPLLKKRWNTKAQPWFELHQPDSLITKFTSKIDNSTTINSLNLTDVYIVLNGSSSSVELLINSLKSYINVHIINNRTTNGNNTGSITLYNSIDYDSIGKSIQHTVAIQPMVVEFLNKDNQTYKDGFTPEYRICNQEDILNLGALGETSDPLLMGVLQLVNSNIPTPPIICNPNNFEFLYNSTTSQRIFDSGVIIKQDLPNTN